jgi:AcrR family transcriptional regulator
MAEHQRRRVMDAAIDVFAARGYPATTVDELVAAGQIGVGSFYSLFNGKEECLLGAFDEVLARARAKVLAAAPEDLPWEERICSGLRNVLEQIAAEPDRARIVLVEVQTGGTRALRRYELMLAEAATALEQGRKLPPRSQPLPESLERTTVSGIAWLLHRRVVLDETDTIEALFGELAELIMEPYLGEDGAHRLIAGAGPGA